MGAPTLRPMAILIVLLGKQRPSEEIGGMFNYAPDSNEPAPSSRDLEISSVQWSSRVSNMCWTTGWSQDFCRFVTKGVGVSSGSACFHVHRARSLSVYEADDRWSGRSCCLRSESPPADAKKADGAKAEALWNPRPPDLTGRVTWSHESSWSN